MTFPRLVTDRLVLREWNDADVEPFAAMNADPQVMEHFPSTLTAADSAAMVDRHRHLWESRGWGLWAVERRDTGEFIGFIGLNDPGWTAHFTPCVEVGWRLTTSAWGHGFAPEGARAAMDWGYAHVAIPNDQIVSFTTAGNVNSRRVMEKLGLTHDPADDFDHPMLGHWDGRRHVLYRDRTHANERVVAETEVQR